MTRVPVCFQITVRAANKEGELSVDHPALSFAFMEMGFQNITFVKQGTVSYNDSILPGNGIASFQYFQGTQILIPVFKDIKVVLQPAGA